MQMGAFARSMQEPPAKIEKVSPSSEGSVSPDHVPAIPSITPIKTLQYPNPSRRSLRAKKDADGSDTEVTVTIRTRAKKTPVVERPRRVTAKARAQALAGLNPFQDALVAAGHAVPPHVVSEGRQVNGNWIVNQPDDSVLINGRLYIPDAFVWFTDPNGNKFFVYNPSCVWDSTLKTWSQRLVFCVDGMCALYRGTMTSGCFESVRNLQKLAGPLLAHLWYVKVNASACCSCSFVLCFDS